MSEYFSNFPRILYDIKGINSTNPDYTVAVNIMVKNKIKTAINDDITLYFPYDIEEDDRPDIVSYKFYGDTKYTWLIFLVNGMLDPYWDWPLSYQNFRGFIINKYGSVEKAKSIVKKYLWTAREEVTKSKIQERIDAHKVEVDYATYIDTDTDARETLSAYDWEKEENEDKRVIQLIDPLFASELLEEARGAYR